MREFVTIDVTLNEGCYCNLLYCEHKFRDWSLGWYQGLRKRMPLVNKYPSYIIRTNA